MIGGVDIVFWAPDEGAAVDAILRIVRRHWKDFVFQNGDDPAPIPRPPGNWLPTPSGRQFFLYRDEAAARSWDDNGAIPENANTMLHVLVGNRWQPGTHFRSLTLVCDEATGEMSQILGEIETSIRDQVDSLWQLEEVEA